MSSCFVQSYFQWNNIDTQVWALTVARLIFEPAVFFTRTRGTVCSRRVDLVSILGQLQSCGDRDWTRFCKLVRLLTLYEDIKWNSYLQSATQHSFQQQSLWYLCTYVCWGKRILLLWSSSKNRMCRIGLCLSAEKYFSAVLYWTVLTISRLRFTLCCVFSRLYLGAFLLSLLPACVPEVGILDQPSQPGTLIRSV